MRADFRRASKNRASGTALWILQNDSFQRWLQSSNDFPQDSSLLWINGLPGTGKTVMSSTIIEYLRQKKCHWTTKTCGVAYFYCGSIEKTHRTAFNICASALSQLVPQVEELPRHLLDAHRVATCLGRSKVSEDDEVFHIFERVVATLPSTFLVIDSLDECTDISHILSWLENVRQSVRSFHVVCFSRDVMSIRESLGHHWSIRMDAASLKDDIDTYLTSAVNTLPCEEDSFKGLVFNTLSERSNGMFLLANLSIATLRSATSKGDMLVSLDKIPAGVAQMYELILERLGAESEARQCLARRVLYLLCFSAQVMTWPELRHALSWNEIEQDFQQHREPFKKVVCELCFPLIEYHGETDTFCLAHLSVQEFLCKGFPESATSQGIAHFFVAEADVRRELASITLACVADVQVSRRFDVNLDSCPLLAYATKNWCNYLCLSPWDDNIRERYLEFVACPERRSTWILRWLLLEERAFSLQQVVKVQKLLQQRAAECGWESISVIKLLSDTQRALFHLDKTLASSSSSSSSFLSLESGHQRYISNFERLMCIRDLAREYRMAGGVEHGVKMFESALKEAELLGEDVRPGSCWLLNSLGIFYDQQGRTGMARVTQLRALKIQESWLPEGHLDTVLTINELGRVARHIGHFDEAELLHRRALTILEELFLDGNLQVAWTKNALARALLKQGRSDEALVLHQQALATERDRLGEDHPHTLWTLSDIARCYCAQGNFESAITSQRNLVERSQKTLGSDCLDTLWAKNSLGNLYELCNHLVEARELHAEALRGQKAQLGNDHLHTLWSLQALARLDKKIKDLNEQRKYV